MFSKENVPYICRKEIDMEEVKFSRKGLKNFLSIKINYVKTKYKIK